MLRVNPMEIEGTVFEDWTYGQWFHYLFSRWERSSEHYPFMIDQMRRLSHGGKPKLYMISSLTGHVWTEVEFTKTEKYLKALESDSICNPNYNPGVRPW